LHRRSLSCDRSCGALSQARGVPTYIACSCNVPPQIARSGVSTGPRRKETHGAEQPCGSGKEKNALPPSVSFYLGGRLVPAQTLGISGFVIGSVGPAGLRGSYSPMAYALFRLRGADPV